MDGVRTHVSRGCEKVIKMKMPSARTTAASVPGSRSAVGTAGRGRFGTHCTGWRRGVSVTFCVDTRNGGSTQRCPFGHDRFLEGTEKLDIQTRELTDDAFAVALRKMGLDKSSGSHVKGDTYGEEVLQVR